ncbi:hypothetical protein AAF712_016600 [Marasmius tenuissimus]|uniref:Heterokaryon incompatibility domain-containing protein n=1 Tax=Marasmius tenuissimus TaxID=585030 RepID=A0ABR2Z779_9AGAR
MGNTDSSLNSTASDNVDAAQVANLDLRTQTAESTSRVGDIPTAEALFEERKRRMMEEILQDTRSNFHSALAQAGELSRHSVAGTSQAPSAPDHAHKLNGLMIACEGLLRNPAQMFQDMVIKLAEEKMRENGNHESEPSTPSTPAAIGILDPQNIVFSAPISTLSDAVVDISGKATPCRYRFIDCSCLVHEHILRVVEYDSDLFDLQSQTYAATSYIWRGIIGPVSSSMGSNGSFSVAGATDGDPISLDILIHIARACLLDKIPLAWLDRLCIIQTHRDDKSWQIQKMYGVYAHCTKCYVLPGGTRRLASLEEPTLWIHRGWTLQEAVAPKKCSVVIQWTLPGGTYANPKQRMGTTGTIDEIVPGESAQVPLRSLLMASVADIVEFRVCSPETFTGRQVDVDIRIFGGDVAGRRHAFALSAAMKPGSESGDPHGIRKNTALWRSAAMRTSSRPVDMVFSIMGLFGVTLNPKDFKAQDRLGATIALAQQILKQGGSPTWLTMSLALPQNPSLRSFPAFPETDVAGTAVYVVGGGHKVEAADSMEDIDGWLGTEMTQKAHMDPHGCLTLTALSTPVQRMNVFQPRHSSPQTTYENQLLQFHNTHVPPFIVDNHGEVWKVMDPEGDTKTSTKPKFFVVELGRMFTWSSSRFFDSRALTRAILLEEIEEGKFSRPERGSWFTFNQVTYGFEGWKEGVFNI